MEIKSNSTHKIKSFKFFFTKTWYFFIIYNQQYKEWLLRQVGMADAAGPSRRGRPQGKRRGHNWSGHSANGPKSVSGDAATISSTDKSHFQNEQSVNAACEQPASEVIEEHQDLAGLSQLQRIAIALHSSDYTDLFAAEYEDNAYAFAAGAGAFALPPTTYRARLRGEKAELYDRRRKLQVRDQMAIALQANNERHWSPSMLARSLTYFTSSTIWQRSIEERQRRIASQPTILKFARLMADCRPRPAWEQNAHVAVFAADQTYDWIGMAKRGARQVFIAYHHTPACAMQ